VAISTSANTVAERVMHLVGHPEVIEEPWFATGRERAQHADLLDAYVGDWIAERDRDEVLRAFEEAGAAAGPVYDAADIMADPQVQALSMITSVDDTDLGPMRMHNVLCRMSDTPGSIRFTGRDLGADTDAILIGELGMSPEEVEELRMRGIIR
jgi:crotonobetainyl-CoA:carnitine CoA-transferase CaiB-like acyl-CoA transferase